MAKTKEEFQKELIEKYQHWQEVDKNETNRAWRGKAHDEMRKIKEIYLKNFHESIDKLKKYDII